MTPPQRSPGRYLRTAALMLVCGLVPLAGAQCSRGPTTAEVTLPGFLAVYYQQFRSDAAKDTAEFYGGVCVTAVGGEWTVMAERVLVGDLSSEIYLDAPEPVLFMAGWRMAAMTLHADRRGLTLTGAKLSGPDVGGEVGGLAIDLESGVMTLTDLVLAGTAFQVEGATATLRGEALTVMDAAVTTCIGVEPAPFAVHSEVATVALAERSVTFEGGELRVGSLRLALKEELTLSEESLAKLRLPLKIAMIESGAPPGALVPGAGLSVRVVGIPLAEGVTLDVGATGLNPPQRLLPVALLHAGADEAAGRASATFGLEAGAPYLDLGVEAAVSPWLTATFAAKSGAEPARAARHEGRLGLVAKTDLPSLRTLVVGEAFAAATAVTPGGAAPEPDVAGLRLGARLTLTSASPELALASVPLGRFEVEGRLQLTAYPYVWGAVLPGGEAGPLTQWGVRLAPTWRFAAGPVSGALAYDARFTNGASPFGTEVDRLTPLQRASGSVGVSGPLAAGLTGGLTVRATYDPFPTPAVPAGLKSLRADGRLEYTSAPWTVTLETGVETAGLINALPKVPAFVALDLSARRHGWPTLGLPPHGLFEVGISGKYDLLNRDLESLGVRLGVPLAFETLELRPYVSVDFARLLDGGGARVSGYGLDVTFITCCGSVTVGAVNVDGKWGASLGVDLERRPGSGAGTAEATELAPVVGGPVETGNEAEPGIIPEQP